MLHKISNFTISFIKAEGTPVLQCVEDALGAASGCLMCICDIIHIVDEGNGMCDRK